MKKILFVAFMMVAAGGMTYAQTTSATPKKATKPVSTVNSVAPAKTSSSSTSPKTAKAKSETTPSNKPATTTAVRKHKKKKPATKKN